jgi:hypothetical protein
MEEKMTIAKQANFDVTAALLRGQHAIRDAIEAYRDVLEAETKLLSRDADTPEEREIAQRGIGAAQTTLAILRALDGKYDGSAHWSD